MRPSNHSRQRSQAASILYHAHHHHHHHHRDLPNTIQSGSELSNKIQSRRLSRNSSVVTNDRRNSNIVEVISCDCSVSTLGDEFSHDDGSLLLLHESSTATDPPPQHRWKQISESYRGDLDMPPIGPRRFAASSDESSSLSFYDGTTNTNTTSRRQRSILSTTTETLDASEATDIHEEDFGGIIQATQTAVEEIIQLRLEQQQQQGQQQQQRRASLDFTPKPVSRVASNNLESLDGITATTTSPISNRRTFEPPSRLPSESSLLETISPPPNKGNKTFNLSGSTTTWEAPLLNGSREGLLKSVDAPPEIARRISSQHFRALLSTDSAEDDESHHDYISDDDDDDNDDSYLMMKPPHQSRVQRIPSDRPPELAKRLMSPNPNEGNNYGVSLDASAIGLLDIESSERQEYPTPPVTETVTTNHMINRI